MIPSGGIPPEFTMNDDIDTSKTYQIYPDKIQGYINDKEALRQAIKKILSTEQYEYPIYSFEYGIELDNLIGNDPAYVQIELKRRIKECLMSDNRITDVYNFDFILSGDEITCSFIVNSIFGEIQVTKEVTR